MAKEAAEAAKEMELEAARLEQQMASTHATAAAAVESPLSQYEARRKGGAAAMPKSKSMPAVRLALPPVDAEGAHRAATDGAAAEAAKASRRRAHTPNTKLVAEALQSLARDVPASRPRRSRIGNAGGAKEQHGATEVTREMAMAAYTVSLPVLGAGRRKS